MKEYLDKSCNKTSSKRICVGLLGVELMNKSSDDSLVHTKWECKYLLVFVPKYHRQIIYGKIRADIGTILRQLCERKGSVDFERIHRSVLG